MDRERWNLVSSLLAELLELPASERRDRLATASTDDPELEREVLSLLEAHDAATPEFLIDLDPTEVRDAIRAAESPPERIGAWRIGDPIGVGGMGVVYDAVREDGQFEQRAALKLIQSGIDSEPVVERFLRERQILAHMEHPGIARILDGGVTEEGEPWFAMERVDGTALDRYCDEAKLPLRERLALFVEICEIVQYAHGNLVVHRDLKPSNILITRDGSIRLLDFGIAKQLATEPSDGEVPQTSPRWLTPSYASPELLRGDSITTSADIYSLGVVLHELVSGRRPFLIEGATTEELVESIETAPPPMASTRIQGEAAERRRTTARRLKREIQGDLDAIIAKALEIEPSRRYASLETFRDDVVRYLEHRPPRALPATPLRSTRLFLRRHRAGAVAAALLFVSISAGFAASLWQAGIAARERDEARVEAEQSEQVRRFVVDLFRGSNPASPTELSAQDLIERGLVRVRSQLGDRPDLEQELLSAVGEMALSLGDYATARTVLDEALATPVSDAPRDRLRVSAVLHQLGQTHFLDGDAARSAEAHRRALALRVQFAEPGSLSIAESYNELAVALANTGSLAESETYYREALAIYDELGEESIRTLDTRYNLAVILRKQGEYERAREHLVEVLETARERYPENRQAIVGYLDGLATVERNLGRPIVAAPLARRAAEISIELWGEEHPDSRLRMNNAAVIEVVLGRYEEAERLLRKVLFYDLQQFGPEHRYVAQTYSNLGHVLAERGRIDEALAQFAAADPVHRSKGSPTMLAIHLERYAIARLAEGNLASAERSIGEAMTLLASGENSAHSRRILATAGTIAFALGRDRDAASLLRRALDRWDETTLAEHPHRGVALYSLAAVRLLADPADPAELAAIRRQLEEAERILRKALPEEHVQIAACRALLAARRRFEGDREHADAELDRAFRELEQRLGADHWRVRWVRRLTGQTPRESSPSST